MAHVALALGSGGARGYAHIGVIRALEERGHEIVSVAGSSMGSVVGGVYAAGKLDEYQEWVTSLTQRDVLMQLDPGFLAGGLIRAERVIARVVDIVGDLKIEDLPIPFTAVTVDVLAGREVWLTQGPLDRAIRASMGIPGLISPVTVNGRLMVDGGVLNPVPVAATTNARADLTVAVSLHGRRAQQSSAPTEESAEEGAADSGEKRAKKDSDWWDKFRDGIPSMTENEAVAALSARFAPFRRLIGLGDDDELTVGLGEVLTMSLDASQDALTRFGLAAYPPDVVVTIPTDACRSFDFHKAHEIIELGHKLAGEALDERTRT